MANVKFIESVDNILTYVEKTVAAEEKRQKPNNNSKASKSSKSSKASK